MMAFFLGEIVYSCTLLLQRSVLKLAHETHLGIVKTKQILRPKFYWVGMDKDIEQQLVKNCYVCTINQPLTSSAACLIA